MNSDIRWQLLLAAAGLLLIWSLVFAQGQSAAVPAATPTVVQPTATPIGIEIVEGTGCFATVPLAGGRYVEGLIGSPLYPNPLLAGKNPVDREIVDLVFDGLVRFDADFRPKPALAVSWSVSEDNKTIRFQLRDNVVWHDGQPFTARDVAFTYGLLQESDPLWQTVSINLIDEFTIEFVLSEPYAPFIEAVAQGILPVHLLEGITLTDLRSHPFNNTPIGTGPFRVGNDWLAQGVLRLLPAGSAWGASGIQLESVDLRFFADEAARSQAYLSAEIDGFAGITPQGIPLVSNLDGVSLYSSAETHHKQLLFNLSDRNLPISNANLRNGLAYGLDRQQLLNVAVNGQGLVFDGPYVPNSWVYNPGIAQYAFNPISATNFIDETGWFLPEASTVRIRTDSEGITETLSLRLVSADTPSDNALALTIAQQWQQLGITVNHQTVPQADYRTVLADRAFDVALVEINPRYDPDLYDFWSQEAIVNGQNYAYWNDRRASESLEAARQTFDEAARLAEYDAFLSRYLLTLPALTLYQNVRTYGMSERVAGVSIGRITFPRDRFNSLPAWTVLEQEISVACSAE